MALLENQTVTRENHSTATKNQDSITSQEIILIWLIAFVFVGSLIVFLNLATILTFALNSHLRRRSVYCLINLAVADMMYGGCGIAYSLSIFVDQYLKIDINIIVKLVIYILSVFTFMAALLSLALVSLERVFATFFPFRHRSTPSSKYKLVFTLLWFLAFVMSVFFNFTPRTQFQAVFICYWIILTVSLVTMMVSYIIIFVSVRIQNKKIHRRQQTSTVMPQRTLRRERELAMTLFIVTAISLLTWLPYLTVRVLFLFNYNSFDLSSSLPSMVSIVFLIQWLNSLVNPIIYVYRMKDFRKAFCQLVLRCSRDRLDVYPLGNHGEITRDMSMRQIELSVM